MIIMKTKNLLENKISDVSAAYLGSPLFTKKPSKKSSFGYQQRVTKRIYNGFHCQLPCDYSICKNANVSLKNKNSIKSSYFNSKATTKASQTLYNGHASKNVGSTTSDVSLVQNTQSVGNETLPYLPDSQPESCSFCEICKRTCKLITSEYDLKHDYQYSHNKSLSNIISKENLLEQLAQSNSDSTPMLSQHTSDEHIMYATKETSVKNSSSEPYRYPLKERNVRDAKQLSAENLTLKVYSEPIVGDTKQLLEKDLAVSPYRSISGVVHGTKQLPAEGLQPEVYRSVSDRYIVHGTKQLLTEDALPDVNRSVSDGRIVHGVKQPLTEGLASKVNPNISCEYTTCSGPTENTVHDIKEPPKEDTAPNIYQSISDGDTVNDSKNASTESSTPTTIQNVLGGYTKEDTEQSAMGGHTLEYTKKSIVEDPTPVIDHNTSGTVQDTKKRAIEDIEPNIHQNTSGERSTSNFKDSSLKKVDSKSWLQANDPEVEMSIITMQELDPIPKKDHSLTHHRSPSQKSIEKFQLKTSAILTNAIDKPNVVTHEKNILQEKPNTGESVEYYSASSSMTTVTEKVDETKPGMSHNETQVQPNTRLKKPPQSSKLTLGVSTHKQGEPHIVPEQDEVILKYTNSTTSVISEKVYTVESVMCNVESFPFKRLSQSTQCFVGVSRHGMKQFYIAPEEEELIFHHRGTSTANLTLAAADVIKPKFCDAESQLIHELHFASDTPRVVFANAGTMTNSDLQLKKTNIQTLCTSSKCTTGTSEHLLREQYVITEEDQQDYCLCCARKAFLHVPDVKKGTMYDNELQLFNNSNIQTYFKWPEYTVGFIENSVQKPNTKLKENHLIPLFTSGPIKNDYFEKSNISKSIIYNSRLLSAEKINIFTRSLPNLVEYSNRTTRINQESSVVLKQGKLNESCCIYCFGRVSSRVINENDDMKNTDTDSDLQLQETSEIGPLQLSKRTAELSKIIRNKLNVLGLEEERAILRTVHSHEQSVISIDKNYSECALHDTESLLYELHDKVSSALLKYKSGVSITKTQKKEVIANENQFNQNFDLYRFEQVPEQVADIHKNTDIQLFFKCSERPIKLAKNITDSDVTLKQDYIADTSVESTTSKEMGASEYVLLDSKSSLTKELYVRTSSTLPKFKNRMPTNRNQVSQRFCPNCFGLIQDDNKLQLMVNSVTQTSFKCLECMVIKKSRNTLHTSKPNLDKDRSILNFGQEYDESVTSQEKNIDKCVISNIKLIKEQDVGTLPKNRTPIGNTKEPNADQLVAYYFAKSSHKITAFSEESLKEFNPNYYKKCGEIEAHNVKAESSTKSSFSSSHIIFIILLLFICALGV